VQLAEQALNLPVSSRCRLAQVRRVAAVHGVNGRLQAGRVG
jgi:hypothetical protein